MMLYEWPKLYSAYGEANFPINRFAGEVIILE